MEVSDAINTRRSVRRFQEKEVSRETLERIVESGRLAPSWANAQPWRFVVVNDPAAISSLAAADLSPNKPTQHGRAVIVIAGVRGRSGYIKGELVTPLGDWWYLFDLGLAVENMSLAAHDLGLGSVVVGLMNSAEVAKVVEAPADVEVVAMLVLGYPDEEPKAPRRRALEEICCEGHFGKAWGA